MLFWNKTPVLAKLLMTYVYIQIQQCNIWATHYFDVLATF